MVPSTSGSPLKLSSNQAKKTKIAIQVLIFVRSFPGQAGPRDPFQRVKLEQWCRSHLKLTPETNYKAVGHVLV
jgi:hypothetical protein